MTIVWLIVYLCADMPTLSWSPLTGWSLTLLLCVGIDLLGKIK